MLILIEGNPTGFAFRSLQWALGDYEVKRVSDKYPESDYAKASLRIVFPRGHEIDYSRDIPTLIYDQYNDMSIIDVAQATVADMIVAKPSPIMYATTIGLLLPYMFSDAESVPVKFGEDISYIPPNIEVENERSDFILKCPIDKRYSYKTGGIDVPSNDKLIGIQYMYSKFTYQIDTMHNEKNGVVSERWIQATLARCPSLISMTHALLIDSAWGLQGNLIKNRTISDMGYTELRLANLSRMHNFLARHAGPEHWIEVVKDLTS